MKERAVSARRAGEAGRGAAHLSRERAAYSVRRSKWSRCFAAASAAAAAAGGPSAARPSRNASAALAALGLGLGFVGWGREHRPRQRRRDRTSAAAFSSRGALRNDRGRPGRAERFLCARADGVAEIRGATCPGGVRWAHAGPFARRWEVGCRAGTQSEQAARRNSPRAPARSGRPLRHRTQAFERPAWEEEDSGSQVHQAGDAPSKRQSAALGYGLSALQELDNGLFELVWSSWLRSRQALELPAADELWKLPPALRSRRHDGRGLWPRLRLSFSCKHLGFAPNFPQPGNHRFPLNSQAPGLFRAQ